jgi:predicted Zn-dependent protease
VTFLPNESASPTSSTVGAAATATASGDQWTFRLYVVQFGSEVYRVIYAAKNRTEAVDKTFRDSLGTFRRMTVQEIASAQPLRIKVVQVKPGDTVEKFGRRMAVADRPVERFRVLNGLTEKDRVKPGDLVKVVVE